MELTEAQTILQICDRFKKLPSEVLAEDAVILRMLRIEQLGTRREEVDDYGG